MALGECPALRFSMLVHCASLALALTVVACGGVVEGQKAPSEDPGDGAVEYSSAGGHSDGAGGTTVSTTGGSGGGLRGAAEVACPDAGAPEPILECDLLAASPAGCPSGQACYPDVLFGSDPCDPTTFISFCQPEGTGTQGTPCTTDSECAGDYSCVGTPFRCAQRCSPEQPCSDGLICEGVVGFHDLGACE